MKEIEVLLNALEGCNYDEELGNYKVIKEGMDDIVIIKNYRYKSIKKLDVVALSGEDDCYIVEEIENSDKYVVQPLDTLSLIAKKFNRTEEYIINRNNLTTTRLFIGQILKI